MLLLLRGAVGVDRVHDQRALHADERAQAGVGPFELLHHEAVLNITHPGAPVAGQIGAEKAHASQLGYEVQREAPFVIGIFDDGNHPRLNELARRPADQQLLLVKRRIHEEVIDTRKAHTLIIA